ncbi:MAG: hypothetical protein ACRDQA_20635 [Nocardioidaceae bacterium]
MTQINTLTDGTDTRTRRLTGLFGIAFVVLFAVGAIALQGSPTPYDAALTETRSFFQDNNAYLLGDYLAGLAFILCFLPYVVGLRVVLGAAERGPALGARLVLVGGLATVLIGDASTVFLDTLALGDGGQQLGDSTVRALLYANTMAIAAIGLPMALFGFAAAAVVWCSGILGRPLAVLAAAAGVLHTVGAAFPVEGDPDGVLFTLRFAGLVAFLFFVLVSSVTLVTRGRVSQREPAGRTG